MPTTSLYEEGQQKFVKNVKDQGRVNSPKELQMLDDFLKSKKSPEDAVKSCNELNKSARKKYDGEKANIPNGWIENIYNNIGNFIKVGDYVMTKAPEIVGTAWFGVSLILGAIQSNHELYSLFGKGLTDQVEMMVTITHYDRLYDEREKPGFKENDLLKQLFNDIADTYAAMLDFSFTIQRHISGGGWARIRHAAKDFFGAEAAKFQGKADAIAALKKTILEKSEGVFQSKAVQRFDEVQDSISAVMSNVKDIKDFQTTSEQFYHAQLQQQEDILRTLNEVKATTKRRTRWDWAMQDYEAAQKQLNPLQNTFKPLFDYLDQKRQGSCDWIFEVPAYNSWLNAAGSALLCVTGPEGAGKSILLASTWARIDSLTNQTECVLLYLSCDTNTGETGENSPQSLARVSHTLMSLLYEVAMMDEANPGILEECNAVFKNPKERGDGPEAKEKVKSGVDGKAGAKASKGRRKSQGLPDLVEGLSSLASILKRKVYVVLDAVDRMSDEDQDEIYASFEHLSNERKCQVLTLLGSRSSSTFMQDIVGTGRHLDVGGYNRDDIGLILDKELGQFAQ